MKSNFNLRTVNVTRYISPLREGGSLPALAEADDDFKYVLKFKGAGHGVKALIAELIGGEIARALGMKMPELVFANLDEAFGRTEADEEIQDLLQHCIFFLVQSILTRLSRLSIQLWHHKLYGWMRISLMLTVHSETLIC
jgi:hypothetical protein